MLVAKESKMSEKDRDLVSNQQKCDSLQSQVEAFQKMNQSLEVSVVMTKQNIVLRANECVYAYMRERGWRKRGRERGRRRQRWELGGGGKYNDCDVSGDEGDRVNGRVFVHSTVLLHIKKFNNMHVLE